MGQLVSVDAVTMQQGRHIEGEDVCNNDHQNVANVCNDDQHSVQQ